MAETNKEAVLLEAKARITVRSAPVYEPAAGEVLVRNEVVTVFPFEAKVQQRAMLPLPYPLNIGYSYAGTVSSVGADVTKVSKGDRVAVVRKPSQMGDTRTGGHQRYVIANPDQLVKLGPDTDLADAASIIGNMTTVTPALNIMAGLDRPSGSPDPGNSKKRVLVYGGSSQLGRLCVQYLQQAG